MSVRRFLAAVAVSSGAFIAAPARAELIIDWTGDIELAPFYRSFAIQGFTYEGGPNNSFAIVDGYEYTSNVVPRASTHVHSIAGQNGAVMQADAYAVFNGFYSARNYANMVVTNANANDGYYVAAGQGSRTTVQFFTPEAAAARSVFHWKVTGNETAPLGTATSRLDFLAGEYNNEDWNFFFTSGLAMTHFGPGEYSYTLTADLGEKIDIFYWSAAFAEIDRGQITQGVNVTLQANYGNTYEMTSIDLYDANDNLIPVWTMVNTETGETVFNQDGPVPEPASAATFAVGLLIAASARRRR